MRSNSTFPPWCTAVTLAVLFIPITLQQGSPVDAKYRGFTIDESRVQNLPNLNEVRIATKEQIDIVCAVGLPAEILEFFQSVSFVLVSADTMPRNSPGLYGGKDRSVKVTSRIVTTGHKPVLLHELLHAYHDQRLPEGFKNRDVVKYFEQAKTSGTYYASKSHMMQNQSEFFACAGTAYLFGVTAQEPFKRDKVKDAQPEFSTYLKNLFGPEAGSCAGSLRNQ